jgi:membrane protease YdiL (CAAX protease family)
MTINQQTDSGEPMVSPAEARPLATRILQFPLTRLILTLIVAIVAIAIGQSVIVASLQALGLAGSALSVLANGLIALGLGLAYAGTVKLMERRPVTELAPAGAPQEMGLGLAIGCVIFAITIGIIWLLGGYQLTGLNAWTIIIPVLLIDLFTGFIEELLFRGIVFRIGEELVGTWGALAGSALLFGLAHSINPGATVVSTAAIALEAGILLAATFLLTRRLWLATGLHAGWNFMQGGIFGVAVSGNAAHGLLVSRLAGPEWLSGGAFGAEASLVAVVVCLAVGVVFIVRVRRQGQIRMPMWGKSRPRIEG